MSALTALRAQLALLDATYGLEVGPSRGQKLGTLNYELAKMLCRAQLSPETDARNDFIDRFSRGDELPVFVVPNVSEDDYAFYEEMVMTYVAVVSRLARGIDEPMRPQEKLDLEISRIRIGKWLKAVGSQALEQIPKNENKGEVSSPTNREEPQVPAEADLRRLEQQREEERRGIIQRLWPEVPLDKIEDVAKSFRGPVKLVLLPPGHTLYAAGDENKKTADYAAFAEDDMRDYFQENALLPRWYLEDAKPLPREVAEIFCYKVRVPNWTVALMGRLDEQYEGHDKTKQRLSSGFRGGAVSDSVSAMYVKQGMSLPISKMQYYSGALGGLGPVDRTSRMSLGKIGEDRRHR